MRLQFECSIIKIKFCFFSFNGYNEFKKILSIATENFPTEELANTLRSFTKNQELSKNAELLEILNNNLEIAEFEINWSKKHLDAITSILKTYYGDSVANPVSHNYIFYIGIIVAIVVVLFISVTLLKIILKFFNYKSKN